MNNLLASKGITLENMIRQAVQKELQSEEYIPEKEEIMENVSDRLVDEIYDNIDLDDLYPVIGEKIVERIQKKT